MNTKNKDLDIIKLALVEQEKEETDSKKVETFEDNPMEFILKKYISLDETLTELMTPNYRDYLDAVFIAAPKPTTFKIVLHNGQYFYIAYLGKAYEATVAGKKYYLSNIGEKERCMIAISRLLRGGSPLKTKGPDGAEQGTREGGETSGGGSTSGGEAASEIPAAEETGGEEVGGEEELSESFIKKEIIRTILLKEISDPSVEKAISQLDVLAQKVGMTKVKPSKNFLATWKNSSGDEVSLYKDRSNLEIYFDTEHSSGNDPLEVWYKINTWKKNVPYRIKPNTIKAIDKIINSAIGKKYNFKKQTDWERLGNLDKISGEEFKKILSKVFGNPKILVYGPKQGPNESSKYNMYYFETKEGPVSIVLSGGANEGEKYEKNILDKMKKSAGKSIDQIEDKEVKQIFSSIKVDPKKLSPEDIKFAGDKDTKRSLDLTGPKPIGQKVADIRIDKTDTNISLKDKSGKAFYNGGIVPFIVNKDGKAALDPSKIDAKPLVKDMFELFNIDPKKVVKGLNQYIVSKGIVKEEPEDSDSGFVNVSVSDPKTIKNLLASGYGYGYYYVRQKKDGVFVYNVASKKDAEKLVGDVKSVQIKYPSPTSKILRVKIGVNSPVFGETHYFIDMRNSKGNVLPLDLKMTSEK